MRGFSLMELMVVLVVFGLLLGFGVPSYHRYMDSQALLGATQNLTQTVQMQRTRAMSTGTSVSLSFNSAGWTVQSGGMATRHPFPKGVSLVSAAPATVVFTRDGRVSPSSVVVLGDRRGTRDTVSVLVSGLTLVR
jgi:prepilin-type N-terminal cleavage/methylation domain-containing protein